MRDDAGFDVRAIEAALEILRHTFGPRFPEDVTPSEMWDLARRLERERAEREGGDD